MKDILEHETLKNKDLRRALLRSVKRIVRGVWEDERFTRPNPNVRNIYHDHLLEVLLDVAEVFKGQLSAPVDTSLGSGWEGVLTPEHIKAAVSRLETECARLNPWKTDPEIVANIIDPFIQDNTGDLPSIMSGEQDLSKYLNTRYGMRDLDRDLKSRGSSLFLLTMAHSYNLVIGPGLTDDDVQHMVDAAGQAHVKELLGRIGIGASNVPTQELDQLLCPPNSPEGQLYWLRGGPYGPEPLAGIELSLRFGWRELRPGRSLSHFLPA